MKIQEVISNLNIVELGMIIKGNEVFEELDREELLNIVMSESEYMFSIRLDIFVKLRNE